MQNRGYYKAGNYEPWHTRFLYQITWCGANLAKLCKIIKKMVLFGYISTRIEVYFSHSNKIELEPFLDVIS